MNSDPTVFVVDDDPAVRESLSALARASQLQVQCFESAQEFLDAVDLSRPGCLVLDVRMPGMGGLELQEKLINDGICLPIIFITGHGEVPTSVQAMKQGAVDFLEKPYRPGKLRESILRAIEMDFERRKNQARLSEIKSRMDQLTFSEQAVVERIVAGKTNKVIASDLNISLRTVQFRRASIMKKMKANSRADLVGLMLSLKLG